MIKKLENRNTEDDILRMTGKREGDKDHYYFYWNIEKPFEIDEFEKEYTDTYNLKYAGMLKALKRRYERPS